MSTALALVATGCGVSQQDEEFGAVESAATLASQDGRVKVKDRAAKSSDGTGLVLSVTLPKTAGAVSASVGDEPAGDFKASRTGKVDVALDEQALAHALAGEPIHVLASAQADGRLFGSVALAPGLRLSKTSLALKSLATDPAEGEIEVLLESKAAVQSAQATVGSARVVPGTDQSIVWELSARDVAHLLVAGQTASIKLQQGGKAVNVLATWSALVQAPAARDVPADFDLAFARLAETSTQKIAAEGLDETQRGVLQAIAETLDSAADPRLALNVSRLTVVDGAYTVLQGSGRLTKDGGVHGESWWLPLPTLRQQLETAMHGLPIEVRWEGEKR